MLKEYIGQICGTTARSGTDIDMVSFWTFCLVVATIFLYFVAKLQLTGINKTTKADFIKRFNCEFFVESVRNIVMLLDTGAFRYCSKYIKVDEDQQSYPYFEIIPHVLDQMVMSDDIKTILVNKRFYTAYELDDSLLGRFEDIGLFEKQGLLNTHDVYNHFFWYIDITWNNSEITKYIQSQREIYGDAIYSHFEYIYKKCSRLDTSLKLKDVMSQRLKFWQ